MLDLLTVLTGNPTPGGTWIVSPTSPGTPDAGTFNAAAGLFTTDGHTPGTFIFEYTPPASVTCSNGPFLASVTIIDSPTAPDQTIVVCQECTIVNDGNDLDVVINVIGLNSGTPYFTGVEVLDQTWDGDPSTFAVDETNEVVTVTIPVAQIFDAHELVLLIANEDDTDCQFTFTAFVNLEPNLCAGSDIDLTLCDTETCYNLAIQSVGATIPAGSTVSYVHNLDPSELDITDPSCVDFSNVPPQTFTLSRVILNDGCSDTMDFNITIVAGADVGMNTNTNDTSCSDNYCLYTEFNALNGGTVDSGGTWVFTSGNDIIIGGTTYSSSTNPTLPGSNPCVEFTADGLHFFQYSIFDACTGSNLMATFAVNVTNCPLPPSVTVTGSLATITPCDQTVSACVPSGSGTAIDPFTDVVLADGTSLSGEPGFSFPYTSNVDLATDLTTWLSTNGGGTVSTFGTDDGTNACISFQFSNIAVEFSHIVYSQGTAYATGACANQTNATANITNCTNPVYSWSNGATGPTAFGVGGETSLTVTVTCDSGSAMATVTPFDLFVSRQFNGDLQALGFNCSSAVTYMWSTGETSSVITPPGPGTYTVTATCGTFTLTDSITVVI